MPTNTIFDTGPVALIPGYGTDPAITQLANGDLVVAWTGAGGIHVERVDRTGLPLGPIVDLPDGASDNPVVAPLANGGFVVALD